MSKGLTTKQLQRLQQLDSVVLLEIIQQLVSEDAHSRQWLINGWLSTSTELLTRLTLDYDKQTKGSVYYNYYEADGFFQYLLKNIVQPMTLQMETLPEQVEQVAKKMLLDFERLSEHVDTSSGSWSDYTGELFFVWISALAAQKTRAPNDIAQALFNVYQEYEFFDVNVLKECSHVFDPQVFRLLSEHFLKSKDEHNAIFLLLLLGDIDSATALIHQQERPNPSNSLELAATFIEQNRCLDAVALLRRAESYIAQWSAEYTRCGELMVTALLQEGLFEDARKYATEAFSNSPRSVFWLLYLKAGGNAECDLMHFVQMAAVDESESAIRFLAELHEYTLLSQIITGCASVDVKVPQDIEGSFWRKLSSDLYKQRYCRAAVILRRKLAERAISWVSSQYYTYASNDAKKAVDYCIDLETDETFLSSQQWLQVLYKAHFRKTALWNIMRDKISGLSVSKEQGACLQQIDIPKG
jgi:hypothetical protein